MKKALHISFAVFYLLLTIGIQISTHYCGSYAIEVDLYAADTKSEPTDCCGDPCESSCCQTEIKEFQIQDLHQSVSKYEPASIELIDFIQPVTSAEFLQENISSQIYFDSFHSPPLNKTNILNCTFRI